MAMFIVPVLACAADQHPDRQPVGQPGRPFMGYVVQYCCTIRARHIAPCRMPPQRAGGRPAQLPGSRVCCLERLSIPFLTWCPSFGISKTCRPRWFSGVHVRLSSLVVVGRGDIEYEPVRRTQSGRGRCPAPGRCLPTSPAAAAAARLLRPAAEKWPARSRCAFRGGRWRQSERSERPALCASGKCVRLSRIRAAARR